MDIERDVDAGGSQAVSRSSAIAAFLMVFLCRVAHGPVDRFEPCLLEASR